MTRGRASRLAASPTMVGAITVLIVIVAVFLAYNANRGLPFVPTYRVSVLVPDAASLVPGDDVRMGGVRVGFVEDISPVARPDGGDAAKLDLKLDNVVKPLPRDSTFVIRTQSALGLKYLQIAKGRSPAGFAPGSLIGLGHYKPEPVELDQVLNMFQEPTRLAIQRNLLEFGNALAGRGPDLNRAIGAAKPLLAHATPAMRNLASPRTELARFFPAIESVMSELAPVAETQGRLFASLDATFSSLATVARPFIQETISKTPPTLDVADRAFPVLRPFLRHSAALFADLRPGAEALRRTAPILASALVAGARVLPASPRLNEQLPPTAQALLDFNNDGGARSGLRRLGETVSLLDPALSFITPAQSVCNYATLLFRNVGSASTVGDGLGTWQRFITFDLPPGPNSEESPSSGPASGGPDSRNFLHSNPYPNTASPGQPRECEAGNERYLAGRQVIGNVPGNQGTETEGQR